MPTTTYASDNATSYPAAIRQQPFSLQEGLQEVLSHACEQARVQAGLILWEEAGLLQPVAHVGLADAAVPAGPVPAEPGRVPEALLSALCQALPEWTAWPLHWQEQLAGWLLLGGQEPAQPVARERYVGLVALLLAAWGEVARREGRLRAAEESETASLQRTRQAERRAALLRAIGEVSRQVLTLLNPISLLQSAVDSLVKNLGYDFANVLLLEGTNLAMRASAGKVGQAQLDSMFPIDQGITGRVARTGHPYLSNDVQQDVYYYFSEQLSHTRSELALPIRNTTEICGVLDVQSTSLNAFDEADVIALSSLADQLGIALENAQLLERLHQRMAELEQTRARLSQAEKLSALGELIASAAHELNNPLTSVIGYAQLMQGSVQDPTVLHDLGVVVQSAQRAARIVEDLLTFARQRVPQVKPVDINNLLQQLLTLHFPHLAEEGIAVEFCLPPDVPAVRADRQQLEQVFINLVQNARQSLHEGPGQGHITLRTSWTETAARPGKWVRIEVEDNGPGIKEETLLRIFDPFFTTREVSGATGMGLSICYGIIVRHGGLIWGESKEGEGASFFVELPAWQEETDWDAEAIL